MTKFVHIRRQHGVGQGGFHSAFVEADIDGQTYRYDYVYDCGALQNSNPTAALERNLAEYRPRRAGTRKYVLDALILSHYDKDHMNGAEKIAKSYKVEKIFLPYLSPETLALEIARQAETITLEHLTTIFDAAHGTTLWGHEIVRVMRGPGENNRGDMQPPRTTTDIDANKVPPRRDNTYSIPHPLIAVDASTNLPIENLVNHIQDVGLSGAGVQIWQFTFWNQKVDDILSFHIMFGLAEIGFPIDALNTIGGSLEVASWLSVTDNRDDVVDAYKLAIEEFEHSKLVGLPNSEFANYISLAMFSGPADTTDIEYQNNCLEPSNLYIRILFPYYRWNGKAGWLGTGDAMLGEPEIWADFSSHFSKELKNICTILLPHHGAAPATGAKFYNRALNEEPDIYSVLSFGKTNGHGHPTTEVIDGISIGRGISTLVTEDTLTGFQEIIRSR